MVAAGIGASGLVTGGVAEEEVRDLFFIRSASGSGMKLSGRSKPPIHYPIFTPTGENMKDYLV
jgi:hypothetical protein